MRRTKREKTMEIKLKLLIKRRVVEKKYGWHNAHYIRLSVYGSIEISKKVNTGRVV